VIRRGLLGKLGELYPELTEAEMKEIFESRAQGNALINAIEKSLTGLTPGAPLPPERAATLRTALEGTGPALHEARLLANFPQGRHAVAWTRSMIETLLPHTDDLRLACKLLEGDAVLQSHNGRTVEALTACRALVNAARSIGDEPLVISQLARMAAVERGLACLERVLAEGTPPETSLAPVQQVLQEEVGHPTFEIMIRGERATIHYFLTALQAGDVDLAKLAKDFGHNAPPQLAAGISARPAHTWMLRDLTRLLEIARRPPHEQTQLMAQWDDAARNAPEAAQRWAEWLRKVGFNLSALSPRCQLNQAQLRCALTAVAVERYQLAHGDWPRDLGALVPASLNEVPNDPFDGQPLRYRRTADGVVVYCVGPDRTDNQGNLARNTAAADGTDVGFQLWDVAKRRRPAGAGGP
jgi:hypothetical protein